jgi:hypothetical protein
MENVQILTINRCCNFKDTSLIGKVRNLNLLNCLCISLAGLSEVSSLYISVYRGKGSYKCFQKLDRGIEKIIFPFSDIDSVRKNFPFFDDFNQERIMDTAIKVDNMILTNRDCPMN